MRKLLVILAVMGMVLGLAGVAAASPYGGIEPMRGRTITPQYCCVVEPV